MTSAEVEELTKRLEVLIKWVDYLEDRLKHHMNDMGSTAHKMGHDYF